MIDKLISWIRKNPKCKDVKMAELKLGDKTIANIDELREHYDYSSVFDCAEKGTLLKWLKDNNLKKEAKAIKSLRKRNGDWDYGIATHIRLYQILNDMDKIPLVYFNSDNKIIANLSELRDDYDFSVILDYFKSGNLSLWLEQNGYADESTAIKSLPKDLSDFKLHRHIYKILHNLSEIPFIVGETHILKIDDLRKNYNFSDILEYFKSGELVAWCDKNGHSDESNAIKSLPKDLSEAQIHLKLYEILNGANNTPQWLREYFKIYEKWLNKQDELSALMDKALPLYESLKKNNYANNEAVENEIETLNDEMQKIENDADEIYHQCEDLTNEVDEQIDAKDNPKKQIANVKLIVRLGSLYMDRRIKMLELTKMHIEYNIKKLETML